MIIEEQYDKRTEEQKRQWLLYGCTSRCLIKLAELAGNSITAEEFCARFEHVFPNPTEQYGILDDDAVMHIIKELGLGSDFRPEPGYSDVQKEFNANGRKVVLVSRKDWKPGATNEVVHTSVLTQMNDDGFNLWTPSQCGGAADLRFANGSWDEKEFVGMILK